MNRRLLTESEFEATFSGSMINVTTTAEELIDLWSYVDPIIESDYHSCSTWDWRVDHIYDSGDDKYQHIIIPVPKDNTYLTVVVNKAAREIVGHHILDLGTLYGINCDNSAV